MFRNRRLAKTVLALTAVAAVALVASGCAFIKPGSLAVTQPAGIGTVRVHFNLCTVGGENEVCGPNDEGATFQYLLGIAAPPGSTPPATLTAVPVGGGRPVVFTRSDEVAAELAAASATFQNAIKEIKDPKEAEEAEKAKAIIGGLWPPTGLQGVGYLSAPLEEAKGEIAEWSVDADFGLPVPADGSPYPGPFGTGIAIGFREVTPKLSAIRPVRCLKIGGAVTPEDEDAICAGSVQQAQLGSADLKIAAPAKPGQAFIGGSAKLGFPLKFGGGGPTQPTFALSATTTAKGGKVKLAAPSFTPAASDPSTHLAPTATGTVTVSVPPSLKPGSYAVTLTAKTPQGGSVSQASTFKVVKAKLKLGGVRLDQAKGIATLQVKVPGAGRLTIAGKGIATVKKKAKKAKVLKLKIKSTGAASSLLGKAGSLRVKAKATFKPSSGIAVSKTKSIVLKLR